MCYRSTGKFTVLIVKEQWKWKYLVCIIFNTFSISYCGEWRSYVIILLLKMEVHMEVLYRFWFLFYLQIFNLDIFLYGMFDFSTLCITITISYLILYK